MKVIGYEGARSKSAVFNWGAAAILDDENNLINSYSPHHGKYKVNLSLKEYITVNNLCIELCETPIKITEVLRAYVFDMPIAMCDREPYAVNELTSLMNGIMAIGRGSTRAYYVFESHNRLDNWLLMLNVENILVPSKFLGVL